MMTKEKERVQARHLRHKGFSLNQIVATLKISKSSASTWVRDVKMTKKQHTFLRHKAHLKEVIVKRVETRLKNENARRRSIMDVHKKDISAKALDLETLKILGTALYWAEGGKSQKNRSFGFWNSRRTRASGRISSTFSISFSTVGSGATPFNLSSW